MGTSAPARTTSEIADRVAGNAVAPKKTPDDTIKTGPEIKFPETGVSLETSNNIIPPVSGISNSSSVGNTVFGPEIIPVKLEIKDFSDKNNVLYVAVALKSIKKDKVVTEGNTDNGVTQAARLSNINITNLLEKNNSEDVNFLKYVPDKMLDKKQLEGKRDAMAKENEKNTLGRCAAFA